MSLRRVSCVGILLALLAGGILMMNLAAAAPREPEPVAGGSSAHFSMDIPAGGFYFSETGFSLRDGDGIAIQAVYFPPYADVDIGFIAPDGYFYSMNAKEGGLIQTIRVNRRGYYSIALRNNSSEEISISGYVSC